jgi:hypothetical protein
MQGANYGNEADGEPGRPNSRRVKSRKSYTTSGG